MRIRSWFVPLLCGAVIIGSACDDDDDPAGPATEFSATLNGASEVDPVNTSGSGTATFEIDGNELDFTLNAAGLTNVTAAHIHGPAAVGVNAGVIVPLFNAQAEGAWDGSKSASVNATMFVTGQAITTMDALVALLRSGQAYVNVHTAAHPGGEIRGQITAN
jgi:hypothetical protein